MEFRLIPKEVVERYDEHIFYKKSNVRLLNNIRNSNTGFLRPKKVHEYTSGMVLTGILREELEPESVTEISLRYLIF